MKTSIYKYFLSLGILGFLIACSTKKNTFITRNFHAVTTEYNVLYNGDLALQAGLNDIATTYTDNFWEVLPVERMQATEEERGPEDKKNPNFERAETKATKAIQKHSMYIGGTEKNPQMDEAHLLLGKSRYYDNRFIPALEAFNYILYKHPQSDKINEAKVWREKTNLRLENEGTAIKNMRQLLKEKSSEMDEQVIADANATLAQAYIVTGNLDSAAIILKEAVEYTEIKEQKARYRFILGQLYEKMNEPDSAYSYFQQVIEMKRRSPRRYVIQAHARQAAQFDYAKGDTLAFMEKYRDLLKDRENRPYLDVLNHQVALFYDKQDNDEKARYYYNKSLRAESKDRYLKASSYRNIAEMDFENARYVSAGNYYDSTLVYLDARGREYKLIKKKRDNLADVIKYEAIANTNDSILHIASLPEAERVAFFEKYIEKLKKQDELEKERLEKEARRQEAMAAASANPLANNIAAKGGQMMSRGDKGMAQEAGVSGRMSKQEAFDQMSAKNRGIGSVPGGTNTAAGGKFYFYIPSTVAYGKMEFKKNWGGRPLSDNWRWSAEQRKQGKDVNTDNDTEAEDEVAVKDAEAEDPRYSSDFYLKQLPTSQTVLDSLAKERNFAYYQLGIIYNEKFAEYRRAADKLEKLLQNNPEERLVLPSLYNLYKIYEILDPARAEFYKQKILTDYSDSRYAEIIRNPLSETINQTSPEAVYASLYKQYEDGKVRQVYAELENYINRYTGENIVSKFELLKAYVTGRLLGVDEYKKSLNFVALTYPNSAEGKQAEVMLQKDIPMLERLDFGQASMSWKIIFKFDSPNDPKIKPLSDKILKFIKEGLNNSITLSNDIYTFNENLLVIHGFNSKLAAEDAVSILKDYKKYKVAETPIIISAEDYKVVQIKKNLSQYLSIK
ncbi:tetratricopeptide repeat protein [Flavobacterium sp. MK4S-17]|uniref:type IX secretion system periplasmic lipoprotein PorW/SprE n=1 Tax=Flavobacterium sp. MK4S-17 TaxID=2543737 RepID=UPI00135B9615|nr:tetratricopeptide repeat protein [Flavobacterium sp. MK4S-17]